MITNIQTLNGHLTYMTKCSLMMWSSYISKALEDHPTLFTDSGMSYNKKSPYSRLPWTRHH